MQSSVDGLGFTTKHKWVVDGKVRWRWLELGGGALMLQEPAKEGHNSWTPQGRVGEGVSIYREVRSRGMGASEPEVGNEK